MQRQDRRHEPHDKAYMNVDSAPCGQKKKNACLWKPWSLQEIFDGEWWPDEVDLSTVDGQHVY